MTEAELRKFRNACAQAAYRAVMDSARQPGIILGDIALAAEAAALAVPLPPLTDSAPAGWGRNTVKHPEHPARRG